MTSNCPPLLAETKESEKDLSNLPYIEKEIKGKDNNILYNIKIYNAKKSIIIKINRDKDFSEIIYKNEYTLEQFIEINNFFKSFSSIQEIYTDFFENFNKKEIIIIENEYKLKVKYKFEYLEKTKEIIFDFDNYNINLNNIVIKLCDKIKEIEQINLNIKKLNKELEGQKIKLNDNENKINDKIDKNAFEIIKKKLEDNSNKIKDLTEIKERQKVINLFIGSIFIFIIGYIIMYIIISNNRKNDKFKSIINKIRNKDEEIKIINNKIKNIDDKFKYNENKINNTDDEFISLNNKFKEIDDKFKSIDNTYNDDFSSINNKIKITDDKIKDIDDKINKLENSLIMKVIVWGKEYFIFKTLMNDGIMKYFHKKIKKYNLLYLASRDGYGVEDFHEKCDGKGFTVILVLTEKNKIFGGFTELEWNKRKRIEFEEGDKGFLFSVNNNKIYYNKNKYKIHNGDWIGPCFDNGGFTIFGYFGFDDTKSISNFDISGGEYVLAGEEKFSIRDYAVYQIDLE